MGTEGCKHTLLLYRIVADAGVVDLGCLEVEVGLVAVVVHSICNVRDVVSGVALARNEDLAVVETEGVDVLLPESEELCCSFFFVRGCGRALVESGAERVFYPDGVGQVCPAGVN